jgi:hypothetical protein
MDNKYDKLSFLAYIHNPISKESIAVIYASNNIKYEKCELYSDFVQSLLMLAFDTYMGDDVMGVEDQKKHFKWCWDKVIENFKEEGISIKSDKLYDYFLEFMLEVFYTYDGKKPYDFTDEGVLKIWSDVFTYDKSKTQADMDTLVEIYKIFEKSLINQ